MLEQRQRKGRDQSLVAGLHPLLPLAVLAQLYGAGVEAVGVAGDSVTYAELDLAVAGQG
jgi:hypothetical protein